MSYKSKYELLAEQELSTEFLGRMKEVFEANIDNEPFFKQAAKELEIVNYIIITRGVNGKISLSELVTEEVRNQVWVDELTERNGSPSIAVLSNRHFLYLRDEEFTVGKKAKDSLFMMLSYEPHANEEVVNRRIIEEHTAAVASLRLEAHKDTLKGTVALVCKTVSSPAEKHLLALKGKGILEVLISNNIGLADHEGIFIDEFKTMYDYSSPEELESPMMEYVFTTLERQGIIVRRRGSRYIELSSRYRNILKHKLEDYFQAEDGSIWSPINVSYFN